MAKSPEDGDPRGADDPGRQHDDVSPLLRHQEELPRRKKVLVKIYSFFIFVKLRILICDIFLIFQIYIPTLIDNT